MFRNTLHATQQDPLVLGYIHVNHLVWRPIQCSVLVTSLGKERVYTLLELGICNPVNGQPES